MTTHVPGIYRYISARGLEYDTFSAKVENKWLPASKSIEEAAKLKREAEGIPKNLVRMTVGEFVSHHWLRHFGQEKDWASTTARNYGYDIRPFVAAFGDRRPVDITRNELREWSRKVSYQHFKTARTMFFDAVEFGLLSTNYMSKMRKRRPRGRAGKNLPKLEAILNMADVAPDVLGDYGIQFRALILFAIATLMRPGEIFELKWEDIDLVAEVITVSANLRRDGTLGNRKNHQTAVLPLSDLARSALADVPRRVDSPYVFHTTTGRRLTQSSLFYTWNKLRNFWAGKTGDESYAGLDFYEATKHCGATWARNVLKLDREQLRIMLGHTTYDFVDLYSHPEMVAQAQNVLQAIREAMTRELG